MSQIKVAKHADIEHLKERGSLIKVVYDTEIYNLNKQFPGIYDIGFHIKDLAGNEIGAPVMYLKQPKDALHSLVSNLITRTFPEDHPSAVDFKTFVGKMAQVLDRPYEYTWDRYRDEQQIKYINRGKQVVNEQTVRLFPVTNDDGSPQHIRLHDGGKRVSYQVPDYSENWNYEEIQPDGQRTRWRRLEASAEMRGYANTSADDPWIWPTLYMGMYPEVFKTHTKAEHKYRVDVLKAALGVYLWGPRGENGLKAGTRFHPVKGKDVISFKQADLLVANTRNEGAFNNRGAHMPNGSNYEPAQAHGTRADTQGTSAEEGLLRRIDMDLYKHFEMLADPDYARNFLMKNSVDMATHRHFNTHPLRAFVRYDLENGPSSHLGMCIATDERYGNRSNAVMLKLDTDWDNLTYNGQKILDIKNKATLKKAISAILFNKFGKLDSPIEITHLKKTPMVWDGEKAVKRGAHSQEEYELALRNRSKIRKNKNFMEALMEVYEAKIPDIDPLMDTMNPLDEQLMFNFIGRPGYFETPAAQGKIQKVRAPEQDFEGKFRLRDAQDEVFYHAELEWNAALKNDHLLHNLLRPHAIEWCSEHEASRELARFNGVLSHVHSELNRYNKRENTGHLPRANYTIPQLETPKPSRKNRDEADTLHGYFNDSSRVRYRKTPENQDEAKAYLTQLRFHALWADYNNDQSFRFNDHNWHVEVVDRDGHAQPWEVYQSTPKDLRREKWKNGDFDVRIQSVEGHSIRRLARMMVESGEMDALIQNFALLAKESQSTKEKAEHIEKIKCLHHHKSLYMARAAFMLHGYPHINPEKQHFLTIPKARIQAHELLQNLKMGKLHQAGIDDIGALEFLADHKDEAERIIVSYLDYLDKKEAEIPPPSREQYLMLGIDPDTQDALPFIRYNVNPENIVTLTCPDGIAQEPLSHPQIGANFIIAELPAGMSARKLQKTLDESGAQLIIAGEKTGERRLAAKAKVMPIWSAEDDNYHRDELIALRNHYQNIGKQPPANRAHLAIIKVEELPLVGGLRGDGKFVNPALQAINIPAIAGKETFLAMVSKKLGNVSEHITGLVLRDEDIKQSLDKGAVRIREMHEKGLSGREFEHEITRIVRINMKKFMAACDALAHGPVDMNAIDLEKARDYGFADKAEMNQYIGILGNHDRYGYSTRLEMQDSLIALFAKNRHKVMQNPEKFHVTVIDLKKDKSLNDLRASMVYFDLYRRPHAAIERQYDAPEKTQKPDAPKTMLYSGSYPGVSPEE